MKSKSKNKFLPKPHGENAAEQCAQMGLVVGDVIEGRETYSGGTFIDTRLRIIWIGETLVVFGESRCVNSGEFWSSEEETTAWNLDGRRWRKVANDK